MHSWEADLAGPRIRQFRNCVVYDLTYHESLDVYHSWRHAVSTNFTAAEPVYLFLFCFLFLFLFENLTSDSDSDSDGWNTYKLSLLGCFHQEMSLAITFTEQIFVYSVQSGSKKIIWGDNFLQNSQLLFAKVLWGGIKSIFKKNTHKFTKIHSWLQSWFS